MYIPSGVSLRCPLNSSHKNGKLGKMGEKEGGDGQQRGEMGYLQGGGGLGNEGQWRNNRGRLRKIEVCN